MALVKHLHIKSPEDGDFSLPKRSEEEIKILFGGAVGDFNFFRLNGYRKLCEKRNVSYDPENRAILVMSLDVLAKLNEEGWHVLPGDVGENITLEGINYSSFGRGELFRAGNAVLECAYQATPCKKLAQLPYVGEDRVAKFMSAMANRRGWYMRVVQEGTVRVGDEFILL